MYSTLYNGGPLEEMDAPAPDSEWVEAAHKAACELDEFEALCRQVAGDPDMSALAAAQMLEAVAKILPHQIKKEREEEKERKRQIAQEQLGVPVQAPKRRDDDGPSVDDLMRAAMRKAARTSAKEVSAVKAAMAGVAPGTEVAPPRHEQQGTRRMELADKLRNDGRLRMIMQMAGRLRRLAESERQVRDPAGRTEVVGVTTGNDIIRALPSELALMRNQTTRRLQLLKLAESKMAQYKMEGVQRLGRGPIVVMLDCSGSMEGDRIIWAAASALACMGTARKEGRSCTVLAFNGDVTWVYRVDAEGNGWEHSTRDGSVVKEIPGGSREIAMRVATMTCDGGTKFEPPFRVALDLEEGAECDRADLVLVTDGHAKLPDGKLMERLADAKERGLRVFGLTIGGGSLSHSVSQLCDHTVDIDTNPNARKVAHALP